MSDVDVIVLRSGAAALAAAATAAGHGATRVAVFEKADVVGGKGVMQGRAQCAERVVAVANRAPLPTAFERCLKGESQ